MDELHAIGRFLGSESAPWWAVLGIPLLTFWIGQRTSLKATSDQRDADSSNRREDRNAETLRVREARDADRDLRSRETRSQSFAGALDSIAFLTSELAKSGIREYGEWKETSPNSKSKPQISNPDHAVDPAALRHFVGSVSTLRLYTDHEALDIDGLIGDLNFYLAEWPDVDFRAEPDPLIERLNTLSKSLGDVYRGD